jgi:uncharacterized protein (TIGR03085 family)
VNVARRERAALCDLFDQVGPDAPTLCGEWRTADLAAHLYLREHRPDAAAGIVLRPLAGYTDRVQRQVRDGRGYAALVDALRRGPPAVLRFGPIDGQINTVEYFVHHEDVRRTAPEFSARPPDAGLDAALWSRLKMTARMMLRHVPTAVVLSAGGYGTFQARKGEDPVTVTGPPGELVLFCFGRQAASRVELAGGPGAVDRLRQARLGL